MNWAGVFVVWGVSRCIGVLGAGIVPGIQIGEYSIVLHSMNEISAHKKLKLTVAAIPRVDMARFPPAISSSDLIRRDTAPSPTPPHPPLSRPRPEVKNFPVCLHPLLVSAAPEIVLIEEHYYPPINSSFPFHQAVMTAQQRYWPLEKAKPPKRPKR
jgi:hypothetical protein